jgi:hypothetical protein
MHARVIPLHGVSDWLSSEDVPIEAPDIRQPFIVHAPAAICAVNPTTKAKARRRTPTRCNILSS